MSQQAMLLRKPDTLLPAMQRKPEAPGTLIQPRLQVGPSNDRFEQEADKVADNVMNMGTPPTATRNTESGGLRRKREGFRGLTASIQRRMPGQFGNPKLDDSDEEKDRLTGQVAQGKFMDGAGAVHRISRVTQQEEGDRIDMKPLFMVQRACAECDGKKKDKVQSKTLRRHGGHGGFTASPGVQANVNAMKSGGSPLSKSTRDFLEPRFGADLGHVRVHTDSRAAKTAGAIQAKAFTSGNHIAFNKGQFNPGTSDGMRLLAHEVTHTFQQGGGRKV